MLYPYSPALRRLAFVYYCPTYTIKPLHKLSCYCFTFATLIKTGKYETGRFAASKK